MLHACSSMEKHLFTAFATEAGQQDPLTQSSLQMIPAIVEDRTGKIVECCARVCLSPLLGGREGMGQGKRSGETYRGFPVLVPCCTPYLPLLQAGPDAQV